MRRWLAAALLAAAPAESQPASDWRTAPLTPGSWIYRGNAATISEASFVNSLPARLTVRCHRAQRAVSIIFHRGAPGDSAMTISTSAQTRTLPARANGGDGIIATLSAVDPLLDAMAFSRGRFAVHSRSAALVLPASPEVARSIEDCRI